MTKPKLYLFIGYPGAGKTTTARAIAKATGAKHLWADAERHRLFRNPSHSLKESNELYERLNDATGYLLAQGKSVIYDTNFNFYADRQKMREIAARHGAETIVIWMTTPLEVARGRAVCEDELRNGYRVTMTDAQFNAIVAKLEPPSKHEKIIIIDGTKVDEQRLTELLQL